MRLILKYGNRNEMIQNVHLIRILLILVHNHTHLKKILAILVHNHTHLKKISAILFHNHIHLKKISAILFHNHIRLRKIMAILFHNHIHQPPIQLKMSIVIVDVRIQAVSQEVATNQNIQNDVQTGIRIEI